MVPRRSPVQTMRRSTHRTRRAHRALALSNGVAEPSRRSLPRPNFSTQSELVVLHVAVKDSKGGYVGGLEQDSFRVLENKRPQHDQLLQQSGRAGTVGLFIDSSGSMAPNRDLVIAASMAFSKAMNPQDEFFVLGFNEDLHTPLPPDKPFTQQRAHAARRARAGDQGAWADGDLQRRRRRPRLRAEGRVRTPGAHRAERRRRQREQHYPCAGAGQRAGVECRHLHDRARRSDGSGSRPRFPEASCPNATGGVAFRPKNARRSRTFSSASRATSATCTRSATCRRGAAQPRAAAKRNCAASLSTSERRRDRNSPCARGARISRARGGSSRR